MSGGYFDYNEFRLNDISREIESLIKNNDTPNKDGYAREYANDILEKFAVTKLFLDAAADLVHHIDYLVEGDIGEDCFRKRYDEAMEKFSREMHTSYIGEGIVKYQTIDLITPTKS